jgi:hypothetical protein
MEQRINEARAQTNIIGWIAACIGFVIGYFVGRM